MADMKLVVDCSTGQVQYLPLTADEAAHKADVEAAAAQRAADERARSTDRHAAVEELKAKAKAKGSVDAALVARILGVDVT